MQNLKKPKTDIRGYTRKALAELLTRASFNAYNADQIFTWIYKKQVEEFSKMTNISKTLREFLQKNFYLKDPKILTLQTSCDQTRKILLELDDHAQIECVLIPEPKRLTLCVSSQVGCKFSCSFCMSGKDGFYRNLTTAEIIGQYFAAARSMTDRKITNIVFMGTGEPLDNFENVREAVEIFLDEKGIYLGKRKLCISTCGAPPLLKQLIDSDCAVKLSLSLHSALDQKRSQIMPVAKTYPLESVLKTAKEFIKKYHFPITVEYILLKNFNTTHHDAEALAHFIHQIPCKLNLIPYNQSSSPHWQAPTADEIKNFRTSLEKKGVFYTMRKSRGEDIAGACGQLRAQFKKNQLPVEKKK